MLETTLTGGRLAGQEWSKSSTRIKKRSAAPTYRQTDRECSTVSSKHTKIA